MKQADLLESELLLIGAYLLLGIAVMGHITARQRERRQRQERTLQKLDGL